MNFRASNNNSKGKFTYIFKNTEENIYYNKTWFV